MWLRIILSISNILSFSVQSEEFNNDIVVFLFLIFDGYNFKSIIVVVWILVSLNTSSKNSLSFHNSVFLVIFPF